MPKHYVIKEYDKFYYDKDNTDQKKGGCKPLSKKCFDSLESFILSNKKDTDTDPLELMSISAKKGIGKIICAKNYVGIIAMKDGTTIEILPKIYSKTNENNEEIKKIFLKMIMSLKNSPYKTLQVANLHTEKLSVFEIFIKMFINEAYVITKRGLKCDYISCEGNENFFKGKIKFTQHIKLNFAHKERLYQEYDAFNKNRSENRLIKSTLLFLKDISKNSKNKKDISILLTNFDDVDISVNFGEDFAKFTLGRNMKEYDTIITWCKIFLANKSFTSFSGSEVASALLFPMESLFESYVADQLSKSLDKIHYSISTQDKGYYLFDEPKKKFALIPDIVIRKKQENQIVIVDTKWKILSSDSHNLGISSVDMYQMYAYQKKYSAKKVLMLYPLNNSISNDTSLEFISDDGVHIKIIFIDLLNIENSINEIKNEIGL